MKVAPICSSRLGRGRVRSEVSPNCLRKREASPGLREDGQPGRVQICKPEATV
jgi:hypothetical protein